MSIKINDILQNYMSEKSKKDLVLEIKLCRTWAGTIRDISVRFTEGDEMQLVLEKGYKAAPSEIGKVYYNPYEIKVGENAEIRMAIAPWGNSFRMKDIKAI